MQRRKIAVVTGTRAEYGLLSLLMQEIKNDDQLELQVIVTGMHLSPEFGMTYKLLEADGFHINAKVEMLLSSDSAVGIAKSIGLGLIGFADVFANLQPDMIVILGDRFEALAVAEAALVLKIPLAHIHGGELSEGALDDSIRHSITKMAHLHFTAAEVYKKRVIQLGENPQHVFNFGAPGLERIMHLSLLSRDKWQQDKSFVLGATNFLVTYLPETLNINCNGPQLDALFEALDCFPETHIIFTKANADEAGRFINKKIDEYVAKYPHRTKAYMTLGDLHYLSLLQYIDVVIGNSSSGLIEAPHFKKPTVNIGNRQNKRLRCPSILDCPGEKNAIQKAITYALSSEVQEVLKTVVSPYQMDATASKIIKKLKEVNLDKLIVKSFYDV